MSIEGKKIAQINTAIEMANKTLSAASYCIGKHPLVFQAVMSAAKVECIGMIERVSRTPHQYFNKEGKIDKRKQRRHERKLGIKVQNSRIVRINYDNC
uniref:Uncharacterized protein n=1 Tax=uncultured marine virus TaxID=186617 RepID=A0A0F7L2Z4_9VIRU|nr:hypothetical protein [uncultured marine virus]